MRKIKNMTDIERLKVIEEWIAKEQATFLDSFGHDYVFEEDFESQSYNRTQARVFTKLLKKVREEITLATRVITLVKNENSHKDLAWFNGRLVIPCNDHIEYVSFGDSIIDYEDGRREVSKSS